MQTDLANSWDESIATFLKRKRANGRGVCVRVICVGFGGLGDCRNGVGVLGEYGGSLLVVGWGGVALLAGDFLGGVHRWIGESRTLGPWGGVGVMFGGGGKGNEGGWVVAWVSVEGGRGNGRLVVEGHIA